MDDRHAPAWQVTGASVRGAAHERSGLNNQDAYGWRHDSGTGLPLYLALADGHGSARSFRSGDGARLSVSCALAVFGEFLTGQASEANLLAIKRWAEEHLPKALVRRWQESVDSHMQMPPLSADDKLKQLVVQEGLTARHSVETNPRLAYGATLLAILMTDDFILYLQLGDGDILTVSEQGDVARPLPKDARLFANETTSLCAPDAWKDFRVSFQRLIKPPALILASTDGYANSFRDETAYSQVGTDLWKMIRKDGLPAVSDLQSWLTETSRGGSGDDITLGLICQLNALSRSIEVGDTAADLCRQAALSPTLPLEEVAGTTGSRSSSAQTGCQDVPPKGHGREFITHGWVKGIGL